jgi:hypothetical protein
MVDERTGGSTQGRLDGANVGRLRLVGRSWLTSGNGERNEGNDGTGAHRKLLLSPLNGEKGRS